MAMVLATIFELLGACTVGARTADTIKNGIIPNTAFQGNAGVQMLAFTCALAGASIWVMWCTRHSAHVSSTYSLISAVAGVGVATVGVGKVQWGWNKGKGLGAIFAGLAMAPAAAGIFGAIIFTLIKLVVHMRRKPTRWAVYTSPLWFFVAGTICTLSIVYKGSPKLGLNKKPGWFIASVTLGSGAGLAALAALFFVPYIHAKVIRRDPSVRFWMIIMGPMLFSRPAPTEDNLASIPRYAVVQDESDNESFSSSSVHSMESTDEKDGRVREKVVDTPDERSVAAIELGARSRDDIMAVGEAKLRARLLEKRGPMGWAMRTLRDNPMGPGRIYELKNMKIALVRLPAVMTSGLLYGMYYDIHAAQSGIGGTPEGERMKRVYSHATKYPDEVEHTYSFVQILTACTASFAHGANDIGNAVGPWAVIYSAWHTGNASAAKAAVPIWQLAVLAVVLCIGFITYGYNIMRGKFLRPCCFCSPSTGDGV